MIVADMLDKDRMRVCMDAPGDGLIVQFHSDGCPPDARTVIIEHGENGVPLFKLVTNVTPGGRPIVGFEPNADQSCYRMVTYHYKEEQE